ncbi:MAG: response regulator transcription factor [Blautia faecis]
MQKILIVEDDIDIQDILKNHLIDAGYEVAVASDGVARIAMFDDTIDLVLLDIMLPKSTAMVYVRSFAKGHKSLLLCLLRFRMKKPVAERGV